MDRTVHTQSYDSDSLKIAQVNFGRAEGRLSVVDERYLIAERGRRIHHVKERHKMRFFELESALRVLQKTGVSASFTEDSLMPGRGLLTAVKPL